MPSKEATKTRKSTELPVLDRVVLALLFISILSDIMGGAIRYFAVHFHLSWLPYLPHLLLALAVLPLLFLYLASEGLTSTFLLVFIIFGVATVYGVFNLGRASQVEFGLWVFAVFLYGIVALPAIIHGWRKLTPYALLLWGLAVAGILINFFYTWPWVGFEYQVGATSIQASRLWRIGGLSFDRLPGFSQASYSAALQILILCVFLSRRLHRKWWIPVWTLSGISIALTTHKTAIVIFLLFSITRTFRRSPTRTVWRYIPLALVSADILLPFLTLFIRVDWLDYIRSHLWIGLIASFVARMQTGWPVWVHMIVNHGNVLLGRGVGGIGAAQQYFEPAFYSPGDNIAVYLYGAFGILGLILLCIYALNAGHLHVKGPIGHFFFLCACLVLLEGVTANVVEGSFIALVFGASFRYLQERRAEAALYETMRKRLTTKPARVSRSRPACA